MLHIVVRFVSEALTRVGSLILFPLLARYLGPEGYGVYAQTGAINGVLISTAALGLGFSVVRLVSGSSDRAYVSSRFLTSILLVGLAASALAAITIASASYLNSLFIRVSGAGDVIHWSALLIITSALNLTVADYYRARLRVIAYSAIQVGAIAALVAGVAIALNYGAGLVDVMQVQLIVQFTQFLVMTGYLAITGEITLAAPLMARAELRALLHAGLPVVVTGIGTWVFASSDRLILGFFLTAKDAGLYSAAYALAGVPPALASPFWYGMFPRMAAHEKAKEHDKVAAICRRYSSAYFLLGIPAVFGLIVLASDTLKLLGAGSFEAETLLFALICIGLFADQFTGTSQYLIYLHNEPRFLRNATILAGLVNVLLNILLVPRLGISGAALSTLVSYVLLEALVLRKSISYGYSMKEIYDFGAVRRICICALTMAIVVVIAKHNIGTIDAAALSGLIVLGAVVYVVALWTITGRSLKMLIAFARKGTA